MNGTDEASQLAAFCQTLSPFRGTPALMTYESANRPRRAMRTKAHLAFPLMALILFSFQVEAQTAGSGDDGSEAGPARAPAGGANAANNPLTPRSTLNLQDYFVPSLNRLGDRQVNQGLLRGLIPSDAFGLPQMMRFTLPLVTRPTFRSGSDTGLGDLTLFDLFVIPTESVMFDVGPLLVAPTATSRNTGAGKWQAGAAGVAVAPQSRGLLAGLVT